MEIKDKSGAKNIVANHLSRIERDEDSSPILDDFPYEQLLQLHGITHWFAKVVNYLDVSVFPTSASMIHIYGNSVVIRLLGGVFPTMRLNLFCIFLMLLK